MTASRAVGAPAGPAIGHTPARAALRQVASGVSVVTVNDDGQIHGATVSAVIAISRDPVVLGVCLRTSSLLARMAMRSGWFTVNVLTREQRTLAAWFAQPGRKPGPLQFAGLDWSTDRCTSAPLLGGCLAHLACRIAGMHNIGDHDLIIAEAVAGATAPGQPLLSFDGGLHEPPPAGGTDETQGVNGQ